MPASIVILGTLDTKGAELEYLRDLVAAGGASPIVIDAGVMGEPGFSPDISTDQVLQVAGSTLAAVRQAGDRGESMRLLSLGAVAIVTEMHRGGRLQGIVSLGGGQGSFVATAAMRALPIGVPKLMVSTIAGLASDQLMGITDLTLMNSVVDISGLNSTLCMIIENAAAGIVGMANAVRMSSESAPSLRVGITMFGVTSPCVMEVRRILEEAGFEVLIFAATGVGDRAMEDMVASGYIQGVVDVTTSQVSQDAIRGVETAGAKRLEIAGEMGVPQVVTLGGLDIINCQSSDPRRAEYFKQCRKYSQHSPALASVRTSVAECADAGKLIAQKLNKAIGPVMVAIPHGGLSAYDAVDGPLHDPAADQALFSSLKLNLSGNIKVVESAHHINDKEFGAILANDFITMTKQISAKKQ